MCTCVLVPVCIASSIACLLSPLCKTTNFVDKSTPGPHPKACWFSPVFLGHKAHQLFLSIFSYAHFFKCIQSRLSAWRKLLPFFVTEKRSNLIFVHQLNLFNSALMPVIWPKRNAMFATWNANLSNCASIHFVIFFFFPSDCLQATTPNLLHAWLYLSRVCHS